MKVYLPQGKLTKKSGIGHAILQQIEILKLANIEYTFEFDNDIDLVHINTLSLKNLHIIKKCKKKNIKVIVHGHSTKEDFRNSFRLWKFISIFFNKRLRDFYSLADLIITPTEYSKSLIQGYGYNSNVKALSNGIDGNLYHYSEEDIEAFHSKIKIEENTKFFLCVGFPFYRKGIDTFFEIAKRNPNLTFIWCGGLSNILLPLKMVKLLRHKPNNVILPGYCNSNIVRGAMHEAQGFLFTSREETEGIVVLEALASKTPLIIRDIGVYDYWLKDEINCLKATTYDDFDNKIEYVLKQNTKDICNNGIKVLEDKTFLEVSKKVIKIYEELLNGN